MKKIFGLLLLPILSVLVLFGCGKDKEIEDVLTAYTEMVDTFTVGGESDLFSEASNPKAIVISYPVTVKQAIENIAPSNDLQKRYRGLYYQQEILDNIYTYYTNYQEDFYRIAKSKDIDEDEVNDLYDSVKDIHDSLDNFKHHYETFKDVTLDSGISDIMEFNITSYTFHLNKVIDASFDFVYRFHNIYSNYCIDDYHSFNADNLQLYVDKAYLDISYVVYLENIKSFNYSVGEHGICDLSSIVGSESEKNLLSLLDERKNISATILGNLGTSTEAGIYADEAVSIFSYIRDVYEQRINSYLTNYKKVNMYNISQYRFNDSSNITYENYLNSLSASDRAVHTMLDNFVDDTFLNYVSKLNSILE